jgi:anti-sigma regulatory factor (Ser/Thr protein kinase)
MPSLKIEITRNLTEVVELSGPITIGRGKDNDIILLDGVVSRHHSRIYFDGPDVIIEDLNSSNGTFVNGTRVFLRALQDKDVINIGHPSKATKIYFSTEKWEKPPKEIDLMNNSFTDFDIQEVVNARDIYFKFPSDDKSINQIYELARKKFDMLTLSDMDKINLDAALNEAVGNAQRHGHKYNAELPIEFRYINKTEKLIMRITDQGEGFDYRAELQRKKAGTAVEEARARYKAGGYGGLGIMLMLKCVDSVEYNRKGNQVTLTKYLGEAAKKFQEEQKKAAQEDSQNQEAEGAGASGEVIDKEELPQLEKTHDQIPAEGKHAKPEADKKKPGDEEYRFLIEPD